MQQVTHSDAGAAHLVGIRRANTTTGGTNPPFTACFLLQLIELNVIRHDHMRAITDKQFSRGNTPCFKLLNLFDEYFRIHHHARADDIDDARIEDARRHQMQFKGTKMVDNRMSGIIAATVANDQPRPRSQQIDQMAFTLIAPLSAN